MILPMDAKDFMTKRFISIDANDHLTTLIGKLKVFGELHAVVMSGKRYVGMFDKHQLVKTRINAAEVKVKNYIIRSPTLEKATPAREVARLMFTSSMHVLPVLEKGKVIGMVCAHDLLNSIKDRVHDHTLDEVSMTKLVTLNESDNIGRAINILKNNHIDRVPVVDGDDTLVGIATTHDLLEKYHCFPPVRQGSTGRKGAAAAPTTEPHLLKIPIRNEMSPLVYTVRDGDRLDKVIDVMDKNHISSVVVVDSRDKPVGIVTVKDLLGVVAKP